MQARFWSHPGRKPWVGEVLVALALALGGTLSVTTALAADASDSQAQPASASSHYHPDTTSVLSEVTPDEKARGLLPAETRASGQVIFAMDATKGDPWAYMQQGQLSGLTHDMAEALARTLGVKAEIRNTAFQNLIPGLQAGRYEVTIAPMLQTDKRLKILDMIGWIRGGASFMVLQSSDRETLALDDALCGMTIGAVTGTAESTLLDKVNQSCKAGAGDPIALRLFPQATDMILALKAQRVEAVFMSTAQVGYLNAIDPDLKRSGGTFNAGISSMALLKDSPLAPAIVAAFGALIEQGAYRDILSAYGMGDLVVDESALNAAALAQ